MRHDPVDPQDHRPLLAISVAADLAGVHPQTLRMYERRGLITPSRTAGGTRRYSGADVARTARICNLVTGGHNLAGIERIMKLEDEVASLRERLAERESLLADYMRLLAARPESQATALVVSVKRRRPR